jgi:hypothetical protein
LAGSWFLHFDDTTDGNRNGLGFFDIGAAEVSLWGVVIPDPKEDAQRSATSQGSMALFGSLGNQPLGTLHIMMCKEQLLEFNSRITSVCRSIAGIVEV